MVRYVKGTNPGMDWEHVNSLDQYGRAWALFLNHVRPRGLTEEEAAEADRAYELQKQRDAARLEEFLAGRTMTSELLWQWLRCQAIRHEEASAEMDARSWNIYWAAYEATAVIYEVAPTELDELHLAVQGYDVFFTKIPVQQGTLERFFQARHRLIIHFEWEMNEAAWEAYIKDQETTEQQQARWLLEAEYGCIAPEEAAEREYVLPYSWEDWMHKVRVEE